MSSVNVWVNQPDLVTAICQLPDAEIFELIKAVDKQVDNLGFTLRLAKEFTIRAYLTYLTVE